MVDALRHWVAAYRRQEDALGAARTHFEQQFNAPGALWGDRRSGDDAGLSLHSVLRNTTLAATRSVDVRCPTCRSEEHTSELQSLMRISYAVFCLKKKTKDSTTLNLTSNKT